MVEQSFQTFNCFKYNLLKNRAGRSKELFFVKCFWYSQVISNFSNYTNWPNTFNIYLHFIIFYMLKSFFLDKIEFCYRWYKLNLKDSYPKKVKGWNQQSVGRAVKWKQAIFKDYKNIIGSSKQIFPAVVPHILHYMNIDDTTNTCNIMLCACCV